MNKIGVRTLILQCCYLMVLAYWFGCFSYHKGVQYSYPKNCLMTKNFHHWLVNKEKCIYIWYYLLKNCRLDFYCYSWTDFWLNRGQRKCIYIFMEYYFNYNSEIQFGRKSMSCSIGNQRDITLPIFLFGVFVCSA